MTAIKPATQTTEIEAAVLRRLLKHLDQHKEAQNIDLMIVADFCRNCLAKWYQSEAEQRGVTIGSDTARELIYGMPYSQWKADHQTEATPAQMALFEQRRANKY